MSDSDSGGIYLTTNPTQLISWNTAFNAAVWGGVPSFAGSYIDIPTPYGEYSLASVGLGVGLLSYLALVIYNRGIEGFIVELWNEITSDIEQAIVDIGGDIRPANDPVAAAAFLKKYGVTVQQAVDAFHIADPSYVNYSWADLKAAFVRFCNEHYLTALPLIGDSGSRYGMTLDQAVGLWRASTPDWATHAGTGPGSIDEWLKNQEAWHKKYPSSVYPQNWKYGGPIGPPPLPRNRVPRAMASYQGINPYKPSGKDSSDETVATLLILLGGTAIGSYYNQAFAGASLGTVGAIVYAKRKREVEVPVQQTTNKFARIY